MERRSNGILREKGLPVIYEVGPGVHEWDFWNRYIKRILVWLPLEEPAAGSYSGKIGDAGRP